MKQIKKIVELVIDLEGLDSEEFGCDVISLVDRPAIQVGFQAFASEEFVEPNPGETEADFMGRCIPVHVGEGYDPSQAAAICYSKWDQKELAAGDKVSFDFDGTADTARGRDLVIKELESGSTVYIISARNEDTGIKEWAQTNNITSLAGIYATGSNKAKEEKVLSLGITKHYDNNPDVVAALPSVGHQFTEECDHGHLTDTEMEAILNLAEGLGEEMNLNAVMIDFTKAEFDTLGDYLKGLAGLDVLTGDGHSVATKYQYAGPSAERNFCKAMLRMNKLYTRDDINQMSASIDTGFRHQGQTYSIFDLKGGKYCNHYWSEVQVITNPDGGEVYINKGPARGDAGTPTDFLPSRGAYGMQKVEFSVQDEDQRIVTGPALIPNKFIIRKDAEGNPFYVYFTKETIRKISERFFKKNNQNNTDVMHDHNIVESNTMLESWIVNDPKFDKSSQYGFSLPTGTWMVSYKINNEETWQRIKAGELKGFSIAGDFIEKWYNE
jgi:hypothetical protein